MAFEVKMPKFGETMSEGTIFSWLKDKGQKVKEGDPLFEIETDKATLEVEAPATGILAKISVEEGGSAPIGEVVAIIAEEGENIEDLDTKQETNTVNNEPQSHETPKNYDLCVIGGGPGGYVAAIRAAQLGQRVALIEKDRVGGTCLNRGCIPTKTYLRHSQILNDLDKLDMYGINVDLSSINWDKMRERKNKVVNTLTGGVQGLLKKNEVDLYNGTGKLLTNNRIKIEGNNTVIEAENVIIATGSKPIIPNIKGKNHEDVITSKEALDLKELPESIVIIGGGVIGVEMATIYNSLEIEVTIVEMMDSIIPNFDREVKSILEKTLKQKGVNIYKDERVTAIEEKNEGLEVILDSSKKIENVDKVLVATGRQANLNGIGKLEFNIDKRGFLIVDEYMRTNISNIYAIGDVTGGILLAHKASAEGLIAAENTAGKEKKMDYSAVPGCIYTLPEIASVGLNEEEARDRGYQVDTGKFPFEASGKALAAGHTEGFVKIVTDKKWDQILGVQIIGHHATELIGEAVLAVRLEVTARVLATTIHAHPTLSEALMEAAHSVKDEAIHI